MYGVQQGLQGFPSQYRGGLVKLQQVVCASAQSTIVFPDIRQDFEDLILSLVGRTSSSDGTQVYAIVQATFNGDTATNYESQSVRNHSTTVEGASGTSVAYMEVGIITSSLATASEPGVVELLIPSYARSVFKKLMFCQSWESGKENDPGGNNYTQVGGGSWHSTAAVTKITLTPDRGTAFATGSVATLYGRY